MKDLAQAISALINSSPRSPWVEEIEAVIRQHGPEALCDEVQRFAADYLSTAIPSFVRPGVSKPFGLRFPGVYNAPKAIALYTQSLLLVDPRDDERSVSGTLLRPPLLCAVWYDEEMDLVTGIEIRPWGAARALAPARYERLIKAWGEAVRQAKVTP